MSVRSKKRKSLRQGRLALVLIAMTTQKNVSWLTSQTMLKLLKVLCFNSEETCSSKRVFVHVCVWWFLFFYKSFLEL
jgi:hypothetical protein